MRVGLVGSEMCIRDSTHTHTHTHVSYWFISVELPLVGLYCSHVEHIKHEFLILRDHSQIQFILFDFAAKDKAVSLQLNLQTET